MNVESEKNGIGAPAYGDKQEPLSGNESSVEAGDGTITEAPQGALHRNLKGRHMQMIAMQVHNSA